MLAVAISVSISAGNASAKDILEALGPPQSDSSVATIDNGNIKATIAPTTKAVSVGGDVPVVAKFDVAPGWHIYGSPLPQGYVPTTVRFDDDAVAKQSFDFPKPEMVKFEALGETMPVYHGAFEATGKLQLKPEVKPGDHRIKGKLQYQECSDTICKMPQSVGFELPLHVESATGTNSSR